VHQIITLRIMVVQSLECRSSLYMIFVYFERAFDSLKHTAIWQTLAERGVPNKLVNIIKELYNKSTCQVIHRNRKSEIISVRNGVKQGCVLSPLLFNRLAPNVNYSGRTAPLTYKVSFYIFIQQI